LKWFERNGLGYRNARAGALHFGVYFANITASAQRRR